MCGWCMKLNNPKRKNLFLPFLIVNQRMVSETDLGLSIGGKLKLVKSTSIWLSNVNKEISDTPFKVSDLQFYPNDSNQ